MDAALNPQIDELRRGVLVGAAATSYDQGRFFLRLAAHSFFYIKRGIKFSAFDLFLEKNNHE